MKKIAFIFLALIFQSAFCATIFQNGSNYGLKDEEEKVILKAEYDKITNLEYTPVKTVLVPMQSTKQPSKIKTEYYKLEKNGLCGIANSKGKVIVKVNYDDVKINEYGGIILVKNNVEAPLNPVRNTAKKTGKTLEAVVGLPVTIVAGAMMPIEVISNMGKRVQK